MIAVHLPDRELTAIEPQEHIALAAMEVILARPHRGRAAIDGEERAVMVEQPTHPVDLPAAVVLPDRELPAVEPQQHVALARAEEIRPRPHHRGGAIDGEERAVM